MHVLRFYEATNTIRLRPDSFDDLYLIQRIVAVSDSVEARSYRRFRASESDVGEQKEIVVKIRVEKTELDRSASKLRFTGRIVSGRPESFIKVSSYHTINIGIGDVFDVQKREWKEYLLRRIKQAVVESKRPRLGVVAMDDEKATISYIRGYGIEILGERYSGLSKRMRESEYAKQRDAYFDEIIRAINGMQVEVVAVAGPGFTKDDLRKYISDKGIRVEKRLLFVPASDAERSGVREAMRSSEVARLFEQEQVKKEFDLLNKFLNGLSLNASFHGAERVRESLNSYTAGVVIVNDSVLNDKEVQETLDLADKQRVRIEIFNSLDDAGMQLANFNSIASIAKRLLS